MTPAPTNIIDDLRLLHEPHPLPLWVWFLIALVILIAIRLFQAWMAWKARRAADFYARAEEAYEDALEELEKIHQRMGAEPCRLYAIEVSTVVRRYIERRFNIHAPTRTTEEFLQEARTSPLLSEKYQNQLGHFLKCCDFLKFAKGVADRDELEMLHQAAVIFVAETRLPPKPKPGQPDASAPAQKPTNYTATANPAEKSDKPAATDTDKEAASRPNPAAQPKQEAAP